MSTYKMIQDIEAEDKILGPLTLRQFIFALVAVFLLYINFLCLTKHAPVLLILFLPPALFCGFFAYPFGGDQPTEVWALARIRFLFKPRQRIWNQSGVKELVTITVPKRIERNLTDGLTQVEVKSRLSALANTIDSRGWAIKNVNVNMYSNQAGGIQNNSDRLIDMASLPREVPNYDVQAADDMLDEQSNPIAQQFDQMITASSQAHHQQLINQMNSAATPVTTQAPAPVAPATPADYWFLNQNAQPTNLPADQAVFQQAATVAPGVTEVVGLPVAGQVTASDEALMQQLKTHNAQDVSNSHLHTLQPTGSQPAPVAAPFVPALVAAPQPVAAALAAAPIPTQPASPTPADAAILSLAGNNDLNIATIAREAHKSMDNGDGEVVISLH
jgi:hypothetical protein